MVQTILLSAHLSQLMAFEGNFAVVFHCQVFMIYQVDNRTDETKTNGK